MAWLYEVTNKIDNTTYVGITSSVDPVNRWRCHIRCAKRNGKKYHLHHAINKYGVQAFSFFASYVDSVFMALKLERETLASYKKDGRKVYNLTEGGEGVSYKGWHHSLETKQRISFSKTGNKKSQEIKEKIGLSIKSVYEKNPELHFRVGSGMRGKKHSSQTKEKMSITHSLAPSMKGRYGSLHPTFHRKQTDDAKRRISLANKANIQTRFTEQSKERMSRSQKQPVFSVNDNGEILKIYPSALDTKVDGFSPLQVGRVALGKSRKHRGLRWFKVSSLITILNNLIIFTRCHRKFLRINSISSVP
jgi:group I intron endonuclease